MKKIASLILTVLLVCSVFTGCGDKEKENTTSSKPEINNSSSTPDSSSEAPKPVVDAYNFLTGEKLKDASSDNKRPVAVMVNNIVSALPQYGTGSADIIYEIPVEGGITRLMAVYSDYTKMPKICSVRSCRYYFPLIALGMDAVYIHWGMDGTIAKDTLLSTKINRLDGGSIGVEYFGRDKDRQNAGYALEHTGYFDGTKMPDAMKAMKFRTERSADFSETLFKFNKTAVANGVDCNKAVLSFSNSYFSTFTYDKATSTYKKQHSGKPHMDKSTGEQLSFTNVIALKTSVKLISGSKKNLVSVGLESGTGKYISNGKSMDIKWKKDGDNAPIVLMDKDGKEISINQGKSYIAFIGNDRSISIS